MESEKHFYIILSFSTSDHVLMVLLKSFSLKASLSLNSDKKDMSFMLCDLILPNGFVFYEGC